MTAVQGQLDLFEELAEINDDRPTESCPHCGWTWRVGSESYERVMWYHAGPDHNSPETFHIPVMGKCVSQSYDLFWIAMRANPNREHPPYRTGFDLLGCILRAKRDRVPENDIQRTLTEAGDS